MVTISAVAENKSRSLEARMRRMQGGELQQNAKSQDELNSSEVKKKLAYLDNSGNILLEGNSQKHAATNEGKRRRLSMAARIQKLQEEHDKKAAEHTTKLAEVTSSKLDLTYALIRKCAAMVSCIMYWVILSHHTDFKEVL